MNHIQAFAVILIPLSFPLSLAIAQGLPQRVSVLGHEVATLQATVGMQESQIAALSQPSSVTVIFALDRPIALYYRSCRDLRGLDQNDR